MSINKSRLTKSIQDRGSYSTIPNDIWKQPISNKAKVVFIYLLSNAEKWSPGEREIANATSIGRDTVRKALRELESHNMLIITTANQKGLRTKYEFTSLKDWGIAEVDKSKKEVKDDVQVKTSKPSLTKDLTHDSTNVSMEILTHSTFGDAYIELSEEEQLQICQFPENNQLQILEAILAKKTTDTVVDLGAL